MLATVRLGAIHSVVFGGFAAASLAARIDDAQPEGDGDRRRRHAHGQDDRAEAAGGRVDPARRSTPPKHVLIVDRGLDKSMTPRGRAATSTTPTLREKHAGAKVPVHVARVQRAFVHPLHQRHDRPAEGRAARHRRLCRGARRVDAAHLLLEARRGVLLHVRHRLGRGALVHRLRAAHQRLDHDHVRGRADPPRRGRLVEDRAGLQGDVDVHVAHRDPRAEEAGPGVHEEVRHLDAASTCSSPASRSTSRPRAGSPRRARRPRSSTTTGRPRPAGRSSPRVPASRTRRASSARRRSPPTATA